MRRRGTRDLNVQTMQTYGRDLYESIGETKVAGINREFSPTGTTRGDRFILVEEHWKYSRLFLSLLKKKKRIFIDDERTDAKVFSSRFFDKGNKKFYNC